jgi:riboflavin biosynthesis pyrimidine reductase
MRDVAHELSALYGTAEPPAPGVLHIMHVARAADGRLSALRIGPATTPKSESDFFVVNAARAHADAVLTSAENLRREPALSHALQGPWAEALTRYRRETLHKVLPLTCAILTRSGDLPYPHPVWSDGTTKVIFTPRASRAMVPLPADAQVVSIADLDAVSAARWLHAHGAPLVSVEAGPRTVRALYEANAVSELWLTHWESVTADAEFAGALPEDATLFRGLSLRGSARRNEGGHTFRFERWSKRASPRASKTAKRPA